MIQRRAFVTGLGAVLVGKLAAEAQQERKVWRLAWIGEGPDPGASNLPQRAFLDGLQELGYVEGQNFTLIRRYSGASKERLQQIVEEIIGLKLDLIAAPGTQALLALKARTSTIPIVMIYPGDPVGAGIVSNLSRPGGNITGTSLMIPDSGGKRLEILKEFVPTLRRIAVLWNPNNRATTADLRYSQTVANALGLQLQSVTADGPQRLKAALTEVSRARPDGLLVLQDALMLNSRDIITDFALRNRLATAFPGRSYVESGGLVSYGPDLSAVGRRAAAYIDKILKGAQPGDLPIEQPSKFELVINLKTAKALGLTIPPSLLLRADQVIE